jgi:hypothetical protein
MIVTHPFAGQQPSDPDRGSRGTSSTDAGKRFRRRRIPTPEVLRIQSWPQPTPPIHDVSDVDDDGGDGAKRVHAAPFGGVFSRAVVTLQYFGDRPSMAGCDETLIICVWRARRAVPGGGRNGICVDLHPC